MDTSHTYLALALLQDDKLLDSICEVAPKKQSELIFPELLSLLDKNHLSAKDIDEVVITEGPGSYTGVRIAMTVAKVFCSQKKIPLYTVNTLRLYAGNASGRVVLDARGKRVYTAVYKEGKEMEAPSIKGIDEISSEEVLIGDTQLFGQEPKPLTLAENFVACRKDWKKQDNIHTVVPEYYKSIDAYRVNG